MSKSKTYTLHPHYHGSSCLQHRLIRAAWAIGLTGIKITWYSSKNEKPGPGWWLEADQQPLRHIGFDVASAEVRINRIKIANSPNIITPMTGKKLATTYTKGEWYLQEYTDAYTNIIRCNNGKGYETLFIASTPQSSLPEARANARLMSAAPDLLESLQEIIAITDRDHIAWVKAKAAIEKAIGNHNQQQQTNDERGTNKG